MTDASLNQQKKVKSFRIITQGYKDNEDMKNHINLMILQYFTNSHAIQFCIEYKFLYQNIYQEVSREGDGICNKINCC